MALLDHDDVKLHLYGATTSTTFDTLIDALIAQVTEIIKHETGIISPTTAYESVIDEITDSFGLTKFKVKYQPVRSVTSVYKRN